MIFVSAPFSSPDKAIRDRRVNAVSEYSLELAKRGIPCCSPILNCISLYDMDIDGEIPYSFWLTVSEQMLSMCSEIHVLMLDGWQASSGIKHETDYALKHRIPIAYKKI